jgi:hypothetical protein
MQRYRITTTPTDGPEQTWVLLPDAASATMQAEELANRAKALHVRVYREETGAERELLLDLPPKQPRS